MSEKLTIDTKYIDKMLSMVSSIGNILFTGGEPSLRPEIIQYTVDKLKERNIPLNSFSLVTNGMKITDEFIEVLKNIHNYTRNKSQNRVSTSHDAYHLTPTKLERFKNNVKRLEQLSFYSTNWNDLGYEYDYRILNEGNGEKYGNKRYLHVDTIEGVFEFSIEGFLYLNPKGNLFHCADMSYKTQEEKVIIIGNIMDADFDLYKNCLEYNKRIKEIKEKVGYHNNIKNVVKCYNEEILEKA
jgi:MoaA/NifB/PqqE/SkfB family radical SAM enzyme